MSWEDQGRQYHMWFGHGTAPANDAPPTGSAASLFAPGNIAARIDAVAHAAVAHMTQADRSRSSAVFDRPRLERLRTAMTAWISARSLGDEAFGERFAGPQASAAAIAKLRSAALGARTATTQRDLAGASADLAGAMQDIGLEKWPRFLDDAAGRAEANRSADREPRVTKPEPPDDTARSGATSNADPATNLKLAAFRARFDAATEAAYRQYSRDCSHYLQVFLQKMGYRDTPYRTANEFMNHVQQKNSGWQPVNTAQEAVKLSAEGRIVIAGLAQPGGSGHVEVIGSKMIPATLVATHPMSPQVFSGAISSWPGSRSQGEHSVADGWNTFDRKHVTYWVKQ